MLKNIVKGVIAFGIDFAFAALVALVDTVLGFELVALIEASELFGAVLMNLPGIIFLALSGARASAGVIAWLLDLLTKLLLGFTTSNIWAVLVHILIVFVLYLKEDRGRWAKGCSLRKPGQICEFCTAAWARSQAGREGSEGDE